MALVELAIASGVVYTGIKAYRRRQKRRRFVKSLHPERPRKNNNLSTDVRPIAQTKGIYDQAKAWIQRSIPLSFANRRSQQLKALSPSNENTVSDYMRDANLRLAVASLNLGVVLVGMVFYPPLLVVTVAGIIYLLEYVFRKAYGDLFKRRKVSIAVVDSILISWSVFAGYYFAATLLCFFYLLSIKLLSKTEDQSRASLIDVFSQRPESVWVLAKGIEIETPFDELQIGHTVVVRAGEVVPVDGIISDGIASIDQRALTGEAQPVEKMIGERVLASTVVLSGKICVDVEQAGEETVAMKIGQILSQTLTFKTDLQEKVDGIVDKSALPTLIGAAAAFPFFGSSGAIAILLSSFGYNMRVLAPLSILNFLHIASGRGILIKDGRSLEILKRVDTMVFDKTGTLTLEQPTVSRIHTSNGFSEEDLLTYAAAAEMRQTHPIAKAILAAAQAKQLDLPAVEDASYEVGFGLRVNLSNQVIRVGSERFIEMEEIDIPPELHEIQTHCHTEGHALVMVAVDEQVGGAIELHTSIRPEVQQVVESLEQRGMEIYIISGDHEQPIRQLAKMLGIDNYYAGTLPQHKARLVTELQDAGKTVCFVGDGINDAIALKTADVSVSLRSATTAATDSAQVVLMSESLNDLPTLFDIAENFDSNMKSNLVTTIIPGLICVGGVIFFHFGIYAAVALYNGGLAAGVANAMLPTWHDSPPTK